MKRVVVSGANGFVGSALVKELISNNVEVIALVRQGNDGNIPKSDLVKLCDFDLSDVWAVEDKITDEVDTFFHFAWSGSAGKARADVNLQLDNVKWTVECMRLAKQLGCIRFVNAGSIMEIETYAATFRGGNKPGLGYIYGSGKLVAHAMCKSVAADIGIELLWGMITNAYGPGEMSPRMVNTTIQKCIRGENPQFTAGTQNYDFVYIDDVAKAFRLIGEKGKPFYEYIIGSSQAKPLKEFLLEMQKAVAPDLEFIFGDIPFTGVDLPIETFDCSLIEEHTGFHAETNFTEGCKKTYDWWKHMLEGNK